jgi:TonB family protein
MADTAQHLLGQVVDGRFPLRKLLGVSSNSAVFLTDLPSERPSEPAQKAAIKLIQEDPETADQQLAAWKTTCMLSHPGLLRIVHFGRCAVDGSPCLYVVTELASENLGELLRQRALTSDEATAMMAPVLTTLAFLHENDVVHAGIKPSNILAVRDQIKLSPDRIVPSSQCASSGPLAAPYAPPESVLTPASDVWSLGISLYEALTQYLPNRDSSGRFVLPQLASPFAEIVRRALLDDPTERITLDEIRSLIDPTFVAKPKPAPAVRQEPTPTSGPQIEAQEAAPQALAAAAHASSVAAPARVPETAPLPKIDPLSVPLSPVSPKAAAPPQTPTRIPVSSLPNVNVTIAAPRRAVEPRASRGSLRYFLVGAAATLLLAALLVPRMLREGRSSSDSAPPRTEQAPATATSPAAPSNSAPETATATPVPAKSPEVSNPAPKAPAAVAKTVPAKPSPSSSEMATTSRSVVSSSSRAGAPEALHQVIPEVSEKARNTIHGTVRINVRVELNSDGTVSSADLDSPAASQFFANLALKAARQWQFAPSSGSSAVLRFDFTKSATTAAVAP